MVLPKFPAVIGAAIQGPSPGDHEPEFASAPGSPVESGTRPHIQPTPDKAGAA